MPESSSQHAQSKTLHLSMPVQFVPGVGPERAGLLQRLGIHTAAELVFHFPRSYESAVEVTQACDIEPKQRVCCLGTITEVDQRYTHAGRHILGALLQLESGDFVRLVWFNQPFRQQTITPGVRLLATGVAKSGTPTWEISQPQVRILEQDETIDTHRPAPVYPLTDGLKQAGMRQLMNRALPALIDRVREVLPERLREALQVTEIQTALRWLHFPDNEQQAEQALRRFKIQELFVLQLAITMQRLQREQANVAPECEPSGKLHARIINRLGVSLTKGQQQAIAEVGRDMARSIPMNRLLQGDVGSGKTMVAQYAMLLAVAHDYQAVMMAPTEVLAIQHAETLRSSLASSRVNVALLTGEVTGSQRTELLADIADGRFDVIVGTQALLSAEVRFARLGLVIVDEQHKFGVVQRAKLRTDGLQPHYLVLSATPIPRTIAMTEFGDLEVSTIRDRPPGRAQIHSYLSPKSDLASWWDFVDRQIEAGRQSYVIVPRVGGRAQADAADTKDATEIVGAEEMYDLLRHGRFQNRCVGLLHGRLEGSQKQEVLNAFASGQIQVLVSTTVVEVGIDVPNATVMTILDANRLGLSQLHQLRGRIARGSHAGYVCAVASEGCEIDEHPGLQAFRASNDGFELAELDLKLRGPGDLLGVSQSGRPRLRVADLAADEDLLRAARQVARQLLSEDPNLESEDLEALKKQTLNRYGDSMVLSDVG